MKKSLLLLLMFALAGCDQSAEVSTESFTAAEPVNARTGVVLETMDVESYSYMRLDIQGQEVWLASSPLAVSKGDTVRFSGEIMMTDFHSETLDRTFPSILFAGSAERVEPSGAGVPVAQTASPATVNPHETLPVMPGVVSVPVVVEPLEGGMTIAEIFAEREQIEGQEVSLRAKVVKFSPNVLGKNWITLQDGTGLAPDNILVITSSLTASIGDEVVMTGKVKNDVDIGAGYAYKVLLEESVFKK